MTRQKLIDEITASVKGATIPDAQNMLDATISAITRVLDREGQVRVPGMGLLKVRRRPEQSVRHPGTGEIMNYIPPPMVKLTLAAELKEMLE